MGKLDAYSKLVATRKTCRLWHGLTNPSEADYRRFDSDQIGPWTLWQGNLDSPIIVVGQDWGDTRYFLKWEGRDQPAGNRTNENLRHLLSKLGFFIGKPRERQDQVLFLTNLILCLKKGGLQGPVRPEWFTNCVENFFKPLLGIINPKVVLALGKHTSEAILKAYHVPFNRTRPLMDLLLKSPCNLTPSTVLFPLYHCRAGSVNRNRSSTNQEGDWRRVAEWLKSERGREHLPAG